MRALVREELDKYTQPAADSFPYLIGAEGQPPAEGDGGG